MAYEPTNWKSGDTVTSAKLNKMEQGIASAGGGAGGGALVVTATIDLQSGTAILDKTWQEIHDAPLAVIRMPMGEENIDMVYVSSIVHGAKYTVSAFVINQGQASPVFFEADTSGDYPSATLS